MVTLQEARQRSLEKFQQQKRNQDYLRQRKLRESDLRKQAQELEQNLIKSNYGGSVQEYNKFYINLQRTNPNLARKLKYNPNTISKEINNRITNIEERIKQSQEEKQKAKDSKNRGDYAYYNRELQGLQEGLKELKKGNILNTKDIGRYATSLGKSAKAKTTSKKIILPTKSKKTSSYSTITNPESFFENKAKEYVNATGSQRNKIREDLRKKYGDNAVDVLTSTADDIYEYGRLDAKAQSSINAFTTAKTGRATSLQPTLFKQEVNYQLILQGEKPLRVGQSIETYNKKLEDLQKKIKNNDTKFLKSVRDMVKIDVNVENKSFKQLTSREKQVIKDKFVQGGVTVTPKEVALYEEIIAEDLNATNKAQRDSAKELANKSIEKLKKLRNLKISDLSTLKFEAIEKGKKGLEILKGINLNTVKRLIVSKQSEDAFKKAISGKSKDITIKEGIALGVDLIGLIPIVRGAKIGTQVLRTTFKNKVKGITINRTSKYSSPNVIKQYARFTGSVINNAGVGLRVYQATQEALKVDTNYLKNQSKKLGLKNEKELYNEYLAVIQSQFGDKTIKLEDLSKFLGADLSSAKSVAKGQKQFSNFLKGKGLSDTEIKKVLSNLENQRVSRVVGQIVGALSVEVSSERVAAKLIKEGVKKDKAVGIAGVREFFGVLAQESYAQDNNLTPTDFAGALLFGASFVGSPLASNFFSKAKYKKLTKKQIDKARTKLSNKFNNKISVTKQQKYASKLLKKLKSPIKVKDLNKKEIKQLSQTYIKNTLAKFRDKKTSRAKEKIILRDPIANILDVYEFPGDLIYNLSSKLKKKLLKQKVTKQKAKVRSKVITKSSAKAKTTSKVPSKSTTKSKSKSKSKITSKSTTKSKSKSKSKSKIGIKSKSKIKTKTKSKSKSKSKSKTKVKTINLPKIKLPKSKKTQNKINVYEITYIKNGKRVTSRTKLPLNRALRFAFKLNNKTTSIKRAGKENIKDILKPTTKKFKVSRLNNGYKVTKL
jgi:RNA polymerase-associated protein CTR9/transcription factor SPN1